MMSLNQRVLSSAVLVMLIFIIGMAFTMDRAFYESARLGVQDRLFAKLLMIMGDTEVEESGILVVSTNLLDAEFGHVNSDAYAFIIDHANAIAWRSTSSLNEQIPTVPPLAQGEKKFTQILIDGKPHFFYSYRKQPILHP